MVGLGLLPQNKHHHYNNKLYISIECRFYIPVPRYKRGGLCLVNSKNTYYTTTNCDHAINDEGVERMCCLIMREDTVRMRDGVYGGQ